MHNVIQIQDAFIAHLTGKVEGVKSVEPERMDPWGAAELPALAVDIAEFDIAPTGNGVGPSRQMRSLIVPVTILIVEKSDYRIRLFELVSAVEAALIDIEDKAPFHVMTCELRKGSKPWKSPSTENGFHVAITLFFNVVIATRAGAPDSIMKV